MSIKIALLAMGLCVASSATAQSTADLVTNGNFNAGLTGFTTTYTYGGNATANGNIYLNSGGDHTTGTGQYLNVDANADASYFWSETFNVVANSTYVFTAFVRSINGGNVPVFDATVNGAALFTPASVPSGEWTQISASWSSGSSTSATLRMFNDNRQYSYNDLGVDDISFIGPAPTAGAVPEPASWAMMIGGLGLVGGALRRRRVAARVAIA